MLRPTIPKGLKQVEEEAYEALLGVRDALIETNQEPPHVVVVTDLAKDYDDLLAMVVLKEKHRLGLVVLEGFVANLAPAPTRALFGRGALNSFGLTDIPIGVGTAGSDRQEPQHGYEFDCDFMAPRETPLEDGSSLLLHLFNRADQDKRKLTVLLISSLRDVNEFSAAHPDLFARVVSRVVLQGGYEVSPDGALIALENAANNKVDMKAAISFHKYLQDHSIPTVAYTRIAALATAIPNQLFIDMAETGHPVGAHLRRCQIAQDIVFYERACSDSPFAPHMNQQWFLRGRSSFYQRHPAPSGSNTPTDGTPLPVGDAIVPYLTQVVAYDALAALHAGGDSVVAALGVLDEPSVATQTSIHKVIGTAKKSPDGKDTLNIHPDKMATALMALLKGALLDTMASRSTSTGGGFANGPRTPLSLHDQGIIVAVASATVTFWAALKRCFRGPA